MQHVNKKQITRASKMLCAAIALVCDIALANNSKWKNISLAIYNMAK